MRKTWILVPLLAVALAGCSAPSGSPDRAAAPNAASVPGGGPDAKAPGPGAVPAALTDPADRAIVYNGSLTVRVTTTVSAAAQKATDAAFRAHGFVGADNRHSDASRDTATITLRVPSSAFYPTVTEVGALGKEESREIKTEDVTTAVVDVDARIATQRASVERVRALLAKAVSTAEIVSIEAEVGKREAELASLEARKRSLDDQVALSTITVTLLGPDTRPVVEKKVKAETGFLAGLKSGWSGFTATLDVALTVVGALLPFLAVLALIAVPVGYVLRRRRRATA